MEGAARIGGLEFAPLDDPLAFLSAEHARQRALLGHLERLARQPGGPAKGAIGAAIAAWLACELPLHLIDETESVYPRLGRRARGLVGELTRHLEELQTQRCILRADLAAIATGHRPRAEFGREAQDFVAEYRRRLALEEGELMPLARRGLGREACAAIAHEMTARRR